MTQQEIDERVQRAIDTFMQGYNCSQAVVMALADLYDIDERTALLMSASFGGGLGRMRLTCGAACGMFMMAGFEKGQTQPNDQEQKLANYALVQDLAEIFRSEHGSITCSELLQLRKDVPTPPVPDERNAEYYKKRPCLRMVTSAVQIYCQKWNELHPDK